MVTPAKRSKLEQQMYDSTKEHAEFALNQVSKAAEFKDLPHLKKVEMAMEAIRTQPGRLPRAEMIKQLMNTKGMTRSQAKEEIKRFDEYMVGQYIEQMEQQVLTESVQPRKLNAMTTAIRQGMGFRAN